MGGVSTNLPGQNSMEEESKGSESGGKETKASTMYKGYHVFDTPQGNEMYEKLMAELCPQAAKLIRDPTIKLTSELIVRIGHLNLQYTTEKALLDKLVQDPNLSPVQQLVLLTGIRRLLSNPCQGQDETEDSLPITQIITGSQILNILAQVFTFDSSKDNENRAMKVISLKLANSANLVRSNLDSNESCLWHRIGYQSSHATSIAQTYLVSRLTLIGISLRLHYDGIDTLVNRKPHRR